MGMSTSEKLAILKLIDERKEVLLAPNVTHKVKESKWREIVQICRQEFGFDPIPTGKSWTYMRDVTWFNWKKTAKKKRDKLSMTGMEGDAESQLTEIDSAVLDILGGNNATVRCLPVYRYRSISSKLSSRHEDPAEYAANGIRIVESPHEEPVEEYETEKARNLKLQNDVLEIQKELMKTQTAYLKLKMEVLQRKLDPHAERQEGESDNSEESATGNQNFWPTIANNP